MIVEEELGVEVLHLEVVAWALTAPPSIVWGPMMNIDRLQSFLGAVRVLWAGSEELPRAHRMAQAEVGRAERRGRNGTGRSRHRLVLEMTPVGQEAVLVGCPLKFVTLGEVVMKAAAEERLVEQ